MGMTCAPPIRLSGGLGPVQPSCDVAVAAGFRCRGANRTACQGIHAWAGLRRSWHPVCLAGEFCGGVHCAAGWGDGSVAGVAVVRFARMRRSGVHPVLRAAQGGAPLPCPRACSKKIKSHPRDTIPHASGRPAGLPPASGGGREHGAVQQGRDHANTSSNQQHEHVLVVYSRKVRNEQTGNYHSRH